MNDRKVARSPSHYSISLWLSRGVFRLTVSVAAAGCVVGALLPARAQSPPVPSPTAPQTAPPAAPPGPTTPAAVAHPPAYHDAASGVDVYVTADDDMFPDSWHSLDVAAEAQPLAPSEYDRAIRLVKVALSKYPADLLKLNLERIYLVGDLKFEGIQAAGTNSLTRLYIKDEAGNKLYTDSFIEESIHHEFAHMLRRNYRAEWDENAWTACNPPNFHYAQPNGAEAVREGHASLHASDSWNQRGFLSEYSASDASEDFATCGGGLLNGEPEFWMRVDRFPALKAKLETVIAFYAKIEDTFTETYFRALRAGVTYVAPAVAPATADPAPAPAAGTSSPAGAPPAGTPPAAPPATPPAANPPAGTLPTAPNHS